MTTIVLVRHALPVDPQLGGPDEYQRPLTKRGREQAKELATSLAELEPTVIASSPYRRAIQTVEPLANKLGMAVQLDHNLRGWDSGVEPTPDCARLYAKNWADPSFAWPGFESLRDVTDRAIKILTAIAARHCGQTVIIGSHGTFVTRALTGFGQAGAGQAFVLAMPMPAVYRLDITNDHVRAAGPGL